MNYIDRFTNTSVNIHYIESVDYAPDLLPLVYVPGALGRADYFVQEISAFSPRHCVAMSLRGCGKSDAPLTGYTFEDNVHDLSSVIKSSGLRTYCLMAYSMSVPYAIKYAASNPQEVKGLILCDYPAVYPKIPEKWIERATKFVPEDRQHVVLGVQQESEQMMLWDELKNIDCPVLVIKGGAEGAMINNDVAEKYKATLQNGEIIEFTQSGHELWTPDYNHFIDTIKQFLTRLDT
jgi:pimeloyl-ACP methyl ester carboxylesterase